MICIFLGALVFVAHLFMSQVFCGPLLMDSKEFKGSSIEPQNLEGSSIDPS